MATTHRFPITIKEHHLDSLGHMNNATYLQLYEEARWEMISDSGYGLEYIHKNGIGPIILECRVKFKKELPNREKVIIETTPTALVKNLIIHLEQQMLNEAGQIASSAEFQVGVFDLTKRKLVRPSLEWMRAIGGEEFYSEI